MCRNGAPDVVRWPVMAAVPSAPGETFRSWGVYGTCPRPYRFSLGVFRPENWLFVRSGAKDVGVLLLADHGMSQHWELVYMGLVPAARGKRIGAAIVQHAQQLVHRAGVARLVLAVDAANSPAIKMYNESGFIAWDTRIVYVRFAPANSALKETS